jgi:hypothetical protein
MPTTRELTLATARRITRTPRPLLTPLMLAALGIAGAARAQDGAATSAPSTKELLERIERLEASNRALAGEVETLRSADGEAWLTEERANEIRSIVSDVLADSATRDSLQSAVSTAGWNDGFYMQSADGRFRMEVGGMMQFRYIWSYVPQGVSGINFPANTAYSWIADDVESRSGWDLPNTELNLKGHVFGESWQYKIKGAFSNQDEAIVGETPFANLGSGSGTFRLLDAYVRAEVSDDFAVRVGQFKLPFAREQLVDTENQLAVSSSTIVEHLGIGRSQGVELSWYSSNARAMAAFSNGGSDNLYGVLKPVGTDPANSYYQSDVTAYALTGRFEWKLAGKWSQFNSMTSPPGDEYGLMVGVAGHVQSSDLDNGTEDSPYGQNNWYALTADVTAMYGGATLFGAFFYHQTDSGAAYIQGVNNFSPSAAFDIGTTETWGAMVQASYYILPKWEVFGRFEFGSADIPLITNITAPTFVDTLENGNDLMLLSVGVNWYIDGEDFKWSSDAGVSFDKVDGVWWNGENGWRASGEENEFVLRSQLQIAF